MRMRATIGWVLTILWIGIVFILIHEHGGVARVFSLRPNELGDFFAGVFAPLAFLWLVIAYFQQGDELRLQRQELELQRQELQLQREETHRLADEAARQAKAVEGTEQHARRDTFLHVADLTITELHAIAVRLVKTLLGIQERDVRHVYEKGETDIYYKTLVDHFMVGNRHRSIEKLKDRQQWPMEVQRFCSKMDRLLVQAKPCDPDGHLAEHFTTSNLGIAHKLMNETLNEYPNS